jgi:hypothetical protein
VKQSSINRMIQTQVAVVNILGLSTAALAGPLTVQFSKPSLDRWMYPFNGQPGVELQARSFAALELDGFDDRDGEMLLGFWLVEAGIPVGQGVDNYLVTHARVSARISTGDTFEHDPTYDHYRTALKPENPNWLPDTDAGRPIELFMAGYRNGFNALTFTETGPFGGAPVVPPAQGARHVYPIVMDGPLALDVSNHVRAGIVAEPIAVGEMDVAPGTLVPTNTEVRFDVDLCAPGAREYFALAAEQGRLNLLAASLHAQTGPGNPPNYPFFYTKENPAAQALGYEAKLELTLLVRPYSDADSSGTLDIDDFIVFQTLFALGDPAADYDANCQLNIDDFIAFQTYFALGL